MNEPLTIRLPRPVRSARVVPAPSAATPPAPPQPQAASAGGPSKEALALAAETKQLAQARAALEDGLSRLAELRRQMVAEAEEQLIGLALEIARRVMMQEVQAGRYEIEPIVKEALQHAPARQDVVVHLNPDDWSRGELARQEEGSAGAGNIRFVADPTVARAECVLETPEGIVESNLECHLASVAEALHVRE